jgi:hypothetical protein
VSRIREVMSGVERRALVKILGGGKLWWGEKVVSNSVWGSGRTEGSRLIRRKGISVRDAATGETW